MKNSDVARVFQDIADLLHLKGENPFKIRAYEKVARSIEHLPVEVERLVAEDRIHEIPGAGEAITRKIQELIATGKLDFYEKLKAEFPAGVSTLLNVPGIGPKTAVLLAGELHVSTIEELESAIRDGKVAALPRMGAKTAENILRHIQALRSKEQRLPIGQALPLAEEIMSYLKDVPGLRNLTPAGSLRRFRDTIGDIDIIGTADDAERVIRAFTGMPQVKEVLASGGTKASVIFPGEMQADLRIVAHDSYGSLLQHFTGSKQHNVCLRERAVRLGLSLSEYGILDTATGRQEKFDSEEAFYRRQGLDWIPPELREGGAEIDCAASGTLPRLVEQQNIKGDLHLHSRWSDGRHSIEQMATAARELGYEYIAVTDHSAALGIARGLDAERVGQQIDEIQELNQRLSGIRILSGIEADILTDGSLDLPDEVLERLDIVLAAVHTGLNQSQEQMTARVLKALENPNVDILAHPSTRMLPGRPAAALDMEAVFQAAAGNGVMLEINGTPDRLDLKDIHAYRARELGIKLSLGTDAHRCEQMRFMRFAAGVARRAWCQPGDILNTRPLPDMMAILNSRRRHHG